MSYEEPGPDYRPDELPPVRCWACGVQADHDPAEPWTCLDCAEAGEEPTAAVLADVARALNHDAPPFDLPFSLSAEPATRTAHQLGLLGAKPDEEP